MEILKVHSHFKDQFDLCVNLKGKLLWLRYHFSVSLELHANLSRI